MWMVAVDVAVVEAPLDRHGSGDAGRRGAAAQGQLLLVNLYNTEVYKLWALVKKV